MLENFRTEERNEGQAAGLVDTLLGRLSVRAIGPYRRDIRRRASCESLQDLFTVRFAPRTLGTHCETRQRLFVDSKERFWTEKPEKVCGKTDLARTREQRFGALGSLDGEQVGKVRLPGRIDVVGSSRDVL